MPIIVRMYHQEELRTSSVACHPCEELHVRSGSLLPDIESRLAQLNSSCPTRNVRHTCACRHMTLKMVQSPQVAVACSMNERMKGMKGSERRCPPVFHQEKEVCFLSCRS